MLSLKTAWNSIANFVVTCIGKVKWKQTSGLTTDDKMRIIELLKSDYYIILTHHRNHLSTFAINFSDFVLLHKWGFWAHGLMNFENTVNDVNDFRLLEATAPGVSFDTFDTVFGDADAVCLLSPTSMPVSDWAKVLEKALTDVGKQYDTLYDLTQDQKLSCVELVRDALQGEPEYATNFANLEALCESVNRITPQMFYNCPDFSVKFEVRR